MGMTVKRGAVLVIAGLIPAVFCPCSGRQRAVPAGATAAELLGFCTSRIDRISGTPAERQSK